MLISCLSCSRDWPDQKSPKTTLRNFLPYYLGILPDHKVSGRSVLPFCHSAKGLWSYAVHPAYASHWHMGLSLQTVCRLRVEAPRRVIAIRSAVWHLQEAWAAMLHHCKDVLRNSCVMVRKQMSRALPSKNKLQHATHATQNTGPT